MRGYYNTPHEIDNGRIGSGAFQNGGENPRRPCKAQERMDFLWWDYIPPQKIHKRHVYLHAVGGVHAHEVQDASEDAFSGTR